MKITESKLRSIIQEELLLREVSSGSVLYHRSKADLEPGDVLTSDKTSSDSHKRKAEAERAFEEMRQDRFASKPSRLRSVFLSPTPKSRFNMKGDLYKVEARGRVHAADSRLFDAYMAPYDWPMIESKKEATLCYWENCQPLRSVDPKYIEVLTEKAVVLEEMGNDFLSKGEKVRIIESAPVPVQKGADDTSKDPEVWREHPKIESIQETPEEIMDYYAQPKEGMVWRVVYAQPHDTARQQNWVRRYDDFGSNFAANTYKRLRLRDGKVALSYGAYDDSIEKLKFEEV